MCFLAYIICLIKQDDIGWVYRTLGKNRKLIQIFVRKHERRGQLDRSSRRWQDNFEMNPKEIRWANVD